ncbi:NUDIX domain-containing protein [Halomarina salina]|uniref:NUDIX domain-containing protein n=1 Tax=Halomarina salina TaxID=1872699 RepID=A0ABD5RKG7_9EURY|nr:NUDIX domain-containing protein [Halomarina salina]
MDGDDDATHVVTCFLRNGTDVLLCRRSDAVGSYAGRWGGVAGHAEGDPDALAREEIREETGLLDACTLVRASDPFSVHDPDHGEWVVHPYLFDCDSRDAITNEETAEYEWVPPTAVLDRETVPDLWTSYRRVAPSVESISEDREHGSASLSVRACEVLRDRAAELAHGVDRDDRDDREPPDDRDELTALARDLRDARPSMVVVENRVNRVLAGASDAAVPATVADSASAVLADALRADSAAAEHAAAALDGASHVLTLSRSGTVRETLAELDPERVSVAESRPGGEGVGVAETLAEECDVTLLPDSAVAHALSGDHVEDDESVDAVLVGADTVLPGGRVVNKVGTRAALLLADRESVPAVVVAARDKVSPHDETDLEPQDPEDVYGGDASLDVLAPTFDVTPAGVATLVTEDGVLAPDEVRAVAREARERGRWDERIDADE